MLLDTATFKTWPAAVLIAIVPPFFLWASELLRASDSDLYVRLFSEDGPAEAMQFAMYFGGCGCAAWIAREFRRRGDYLFSRLHWVLSAGLFFVAMEEISWGQRLASIDTPEAFYAYNHQAELNLHNTIWFQSADSAFSWFSVAVGAVILYSSFAWMAVPKRLQFGDGAKVHFLIPGWYLAPYFASMGLHSVCTPCFPPTGSELWQVQEAPELLFATGALLFVALGIRRVKQSKKPSAAKSAFQDDRLDRR